MRKSMTRWLICMAATAACLTSSAAWAVDGYKDLKFGMSRDEVMKHKPCTLVKVPSQNKGLEQFQCVDFVFAGAKTMAFAYFINKKLARFALIIPPGISPFTVMKSLAEKYGPSDQHSSEKAFTDIQTVPGTKAEAWFDNSTVGLIMVASETLQPDAMMIYSTKDYFNQLAGAQNASVAPDL